MELVELGKTMYSAFREMAEDFAAAGENQYAEHAASSEAFDAYLAELRNFRYPNPLPEGYVHSYSYFLRDDEDRLLGSVRFRPRLNDRLLIEGGNVGYDVRPGYRNRGYATMMLRMVMDMARELGHGTLLVTCFEDNPASEKVIRKCGGQLESIEPSPRNGKPTKRFWIQLV